ncbi:bifunctional NAD(P)H-hydrate repair enzyme [Azorhizobium oxalatiphilum]|uniref:Bifunctional NAD(P)H-hydrate repair enzyme n=1 Tax=Azorhizobium oxalatiphilum TaxID=980631 RepID=A0A917BTI1_9HYPH|nr:NAD(P)H-hydrate dehydratase [Azorhizobium oxalatiphilum]GGF56136.1 bifunctional NAD(P)H-hydrate repair enzyme [Azorhizobium oxalatiphilum]
MTHLLDPQEMARADRLAMEWGTAGITLMDKAGAAVADVVARRPLVTRVTILCGPGNNGGDGFVAARLLAQRGFRVRLALLGDRGRLTGDAAQAAERWRGAVEDAAAFDPEDADLIVDALFGAGLTRDLDGVARAVVARMAASGKPVIAVDLPSGVDGATGAVRGVAAQAVETVTFFRRKPGHLLLPGRTLCGKLRVADIGIPDLVLDEIRPKTSANEPALWLPAFPIPSAGGHKYARGHAVVVSGGRWTAGAARLAARACLRAGAGLVTVGAPEAALPMHAASYAALMVRPVEEASDLRHLLEDRRLSAIVMGPGLGVGATTRDLVSAATGAGRHLVLDADALTSFAGDLKGLADVVGSAAGTVVTPHEGEFGRLFGDVVSADADKLTRARTAAQALGGVVVLKGADTVVAAPDGRAAIAANAPPYLATAGAGDVLAGIICGLLAQGMPAYEAAAAGVWLHGEAARAFGPGLIADDLPEALPGVYRKLFEEAGAL